MVKVTIDSVRCKGCMLCVDVCPRKILRPDGGYNKRGFKAACVTDGACAGCGMCVVICPDWCIKITK